MAEEHDLIGLASVECDAAGSRPPSVDITDDGSKAARLPRWTRQEILVLIQGKRVAENRVKKGKISGLVLSGQTEPKWTTISAYCMGNGVNRGPMQCRKRWGNLAGDFKKIKQWESCITHGSQSFWEMRNDTRREKKLPGFFDREVYEILDGGPVPTPSPVLALAVAFPPSGSGDDDADASDDGHEPVEILFDSGRPASADNGLFSDFEHSPQEDIPDAKDSSPTTKVFSPVPLSERKYEQCPGEFPVEDDGDAGDNGHGGSNPEGARAGDRERKRRRRDGDDREDRDDPVGAQQQFLEVLERNGRMLSAQLEEQNTHFRLDREQRNEHQSGLVAVLNKLADALGRIADKL